MRLLAELSTGLSGRGGVGYNRAVQYWEPAFRDSAIVNDATLGTAPHDLSRYLRAQGEFFGALDRNPPALKALITDFNATARAFAVEQESLKATLTELPRTLRAARPALASLNASFPPLRRLVADLRPATRSTGPMIDASLPFIAQLRGLVSPPELQGLSSDLRDADARPGAAQQPHAGPVRAGARWPPRARTRSSCRGPTTRWATRTSRPRARSTRRASRACRGWPGRAARATPTASGRASWPATASSPTASRSPARSARTLDDNVGLGLTNFPLEGTSRPSPPRPEIRYDEPCETQEGPNLDVKPDPPLELLDDSQHRSHLADLCGALGLPPAPGRALIGYALDLRRAPQVGASCAAGLRRPRLRPCALRARPRSAVRDAVESGRRSIRTSLRESIYEWTGLDPDKGKKDKKKNKDKPAKRPRRPRTATSEGDGDQAEGSVGNQDAGDNDETDEADKP